MSSLLTMDPIMPALVDRYELDNTSDSSDDDSYHLVDISDNYMYIINSNTKKITQQPSQPRYQHNILRLRNIHMKNLKQVDSTL